MHEGHRRRMYEKLKNDDSLHDHELLEILLFNALPRKNTNEIAHELIKTFGSLAGVLNADVSQLVAVKGVGENTALYLKLVAEVKKRTGAEAPCIAVLRNHGEFERFVKSRMRGRTKEVLEFYCLDKNNKVFRLFEFTNDDVTKVEVDTQEIIKVLSSAPYAVIASHNHLSNCSEPSLNDNEFTAKLQSMCSMMHVQLYDHLIYANDRDVYSYFMTGQLERIRSEFSFSSLVGKKLQELNSDK